ncbi:MAG: glycosyltransferase family 4 protein [Planctomycetota bacterium]
MSRSLSILLVTLRFPPHVVGGYEQIAGELAVGLRERGHRVHVLCGRSAQLESTDDVWPELEPRIDGAQNLFELSHAGSNRERWALHFHSRDNAAATRRAIRETRPDAVVYLNLGLASIAPLLEARRAGLPRIGVICDAWPANHWVRDWRERGGKRLRLAVLEWVWARWRRYVGLGRMLVASESLRDELTEAGFSRAELELVPLALPPEVEREAFDAPIPERRAGQPLVVVCTSSQWEGKGLHVLLDAASVAVEEGTDLEVVLVGDGDRDYRARLERQAASPELEGRVRFTGRLPQSELGSVFRSAHVFVFPSTWSEPFGRASLEAMAFGLALVASDVGGISEQFVDGESGLSVAAGDANAFARALVDLGADEGRRRELARRGREHVDRHFRSQHFFDAVERRLAEETAKVRA